MCSPDFNAYTQDQNIFSRDSETRRSCGGHLHISYPELNYKEGLKLIQALDLFISIPLVFLEPDSERKTLYGKAGAFRPKELQDKTFIIEYRSPSNFWVSSEETMRFIYKQILKAIKFVKEDGIITNPEDIIKAINENKADKAKEILNDYNIEVPNSLILVDSTSEEEAIVVLKEKKEIPTLFDNDALGG